ncbi:MAG: AI-2E family transporter [Nitrospirae bacterium]|nr:AI-2E family transporter [Nitrospirota bacterium]
MTRSDANRFYILTSISILFLLGYLTYRILQPFLVALAWAVVFTIVFYPVFRFISRYVKYGAIASLLTTLLILLIIVGPFFSLSLVLLDEVRDTAAKIDTERVDSIRNIFASSKIVRMIEEVRSFLGMETVDIGELVLENLRRLGSKLAANLSLWASSITDIFVDFILMIFAVFFFLKDGPDFLSKIRNYLPFSESHKDRLGSQVKDMIISTVYGGVMVAIIQGILGGIAFLVLGVGSPVLWGTSMAIMSFLPLLGTSVIWGPAAAYLFLTGDYKEGIGLLLFGLLVIGMVDNILKPLIISGRTRMPTLLIFFSVIGGIKLFGFIGFIMGPLVLALFVSVFEIFRNIEGGTDA